MADSSIPQSDRFGNPITHNYESWVPCVGYEDKYEISSFGRVRHCESGRIQNKQIGVNGYQYSVLTGDKISKGRFHQQSFLTARLVWESFIGPLDRHQLRRIDGNKENSCLCNLRKVAKHPVRKKSGKPALKNALTTSEFISLAHEKYGKDKFDYECVRYRNMHYDVAIRCVKHDRLFLQRPNVHLRGKIGGCKECRSEDVSKRMLSSTDEFVRKARERWGEKFDYCDVEYKNDRTKVVIHCQNGHTFRRSPMLHLQSGLCPRCKDSKGETLIQKWLSERGFVFERNKRFESCRSKKPLPFDFYLTQHEILIEFDGEQHFTPVLGDKAFEALKKRDAIKNKWATENGVPLIRIPYWERKRIGDRLTEELVYWGVVVPKKIKRRAI